MALVVLCVVRDHIAKMRPAPALGLLLKKVRILSTLLEEIARHVLVGFLSGRMVHAHQTDLHLLVSRNARNLILSEPVHDMLRHPLHHAEQLVFSGRLVIRHCRLHHMACAVEFMAL